MIEEYYLLQDRTLHEAKTQETLQSVEQKTSMNYEIEFVEFLPCCMKCRCSLAMRILSVRLSVKCVRCDKTEERSIQIYIPYERSFSLLY